jgi:hypothetical protein
MVKSIGRNNCGIQQELYGLWKLFVDYYWSNAFVKDVAHPISQIEVTTKDHGMSKEKTENLAWFENP